MRVLELPRGASAREQGLAHGEEMRPLVAEIAEIRTSLCVELGAFTDATEVLATARAHLPVLERWDAALHEELLGIAEGAAVAPEAIVVLNDYTDLRDLRPADLGTEDDCSAIYARTPEGALLGQTWDMHGSALPYVMMLRVPEADGAPAAWAFTITGCLGMTGLNARGVGVTINNLKSTDAKVGVVWPALVRRILRERTAAAARDVLTTAPLGSGHHYIVADAHDAFGIESSGRWKKIVYDGTEPSYVHTNHCLDPEVAEVTQVSPTSTTHDRYARLVASLRDSPLTGRADLWHRLGSHDGYPRSVCTHLATPQSPHEMLTCGALVMSLTTPDLWASPGCIHLARPHTLALSS